MKSVGIVAEYNPFHKGHEYQIKKSKEITGADTVIVVMSGNFTQRGQAAIFDKWTRAEMALSSGADLVVEMPVVFSCNSAGYFAQAGVEILENLGADYISFGSEAGDMGLLKNIAAVIKNNSEEIEDEIKCKVKMGLSYPRARQEVLHTLLTEEESLALDNPNNILAIEYLKNISEAEPVTVKRLGAGYNEVTGEHEMASATYLRKIISEEKDYTSHVPEAAAEFIKAAVSNNNYCTADKMFPYIVEKVLTSSNEELEGVLAGGEGLGNKLKNSIRMCPDYESLVESLKSKRYTRTRIERFLGHVLLNITEDDLKKSAKYVRVLGFTSTGAKYLKQIKKAEICGLPVITNINKDVFPEVERTLNKDILASDLYNLATGRDLYKHSDHVEMVRRI